MKYDPRLVKMGTRIEMEHTKNKVRARKIALDHFREFGNAYYPNLIKMERKLRRQKR